MGFVEPSGNARNRKARLGRVEGSVNRAYAWAKQLVRLFGFVRLLRNGYSAFNAFRGRKCAVRSLDFWDGSRFEVRDGGSAAHIFEDIFLTRCYDCAEVFAASQIVDVGANIGLFSYFARRNNPMAKILAIEADPRTAAVLLTNVKDMQIDTMHCAVSDQCGRMNFFSSEVSGWSSLYGVRGASGSVPVEVPVLKLSSILRDRGIDRIGLLKIDVEGAEYPILLGDAQLWEIPIDAILVEADRDPRDNRYSFEELCAALREVYRHIRTVNKVHDYPVLYATDRIAS